MATILTLILFVVSIIVFWRFLLKAPCFRKPLTKDTPREKETL